MPSRQEMLQIGMLSVFCSGQSLVVLQLYSLRCGSVTLHFLSREHLPNMLNIWAAVN